MKRIAIIIALAILTIGGYEIFIAYMVAHDQKGEEIASSIRAEVEVLKVKRGSYPSRFQSPLAKVWGILPGPVVTYRPDGSNCSIHYYQWPLGPHHILDCRTNVWSFEE